MLTEDKFRLTYDLPSKQEVSQFLDLLEKGKVAPIGEVRTWSGQQYVKHAEGWVHVHPTTGKVSVLPTSGTVRKLDGTDEHKSHFEKHTSEGPSGSDLENSKTKLTLDSQKVKDSIDKKHSATHENFKDLSYEDHDRISKHYAGRAEHQPTKSMSENLYKLSKQHRKEGLKKLNAEE